MNRLLISVCIVYILGYLAHAFILGKTVYGDGVYYFSWARSIVVDRNADFTNEYAYFSVSQPTTDRDIPGNKYAIGAPLVWFPFYLTTFILLGGDGYGQTYQIVVGMVSVLLTCFGLLLLYRTLESTYNRTLSGLAVITTALGTNLFFYGSLDPVNSHAVTFFFSSVALSLLLRQNSAITTGFAYGLLMLTRTQEIISVIPAFMSSSRVKWLKLFIGIITVFSVQLAAWYILNGRFHSQYLDSSEGFTWFSPHILGVLFSPENGLLLWTPAYLMGWIGLLYRSIRTRSSLWIGMTLTVVIQIYVVASWSTWWQGASYSGRMFIGLLPFVAFGLAETFRLLSRILLTIKILVFALIFPLCALNCIAVIFFLLRH